MRVVILIALMAFITNIRAQEYKISGTIKGLSNINGYRAIKDATAKYGMRWDSIPIEKGSFEHTEKILEPKVLRISFKSDKLIKKVDRGFIPTSCVLLYYVAYPGADIKVNGEAVDFCNAYPHGDPENELMALLNSKIYPWMNEGANIRVKHSLNLDLSEDVKQADDKRGEELSENVYKAKIDFLGKHASSIAGLWLMDDMIGRSQIEIEKIAELLKTVDTKKYGELSYYKNLNRRVRGFKESGLGMSAPTVSGINLIDDKEFDLKSLHGKYVLIDFWGTWCRACLKGTPDMKKFRDAHADRLKIVGLAKDRSIEAVKKCMEKKGMNWPNIMVGTGEQDFVSKYNVQGYPTKILLDRNGIILLRYTGEKEDFYHEVEKLISK